EDDEQLPLFDLERQALERHRCPLGRREDAEEIDGLDGGAHSIPSEKRQRDTRSYALRVARKTASTETNASATSATPARRQSTVSSNGASPTPAPAVTVTTETTSALPIAPAASPPASPRATTIAAR